MTGTAVDAALVHIEKNEQYENGSGDKIAEAEALAAEALRMANEAKRAAERLAEVKKTLAMFSKKLDTVEKVVIVKSKDNASALAPKPESPRAKKVEEPAEEKSTLPPPPEDESTVPPPPLEEDFVPPPPPVEEEQEEAIVVVQKKSVAFKEETASPAPVKTQVMVIKKDVIEATLDQWGVDKMCGVDEDTLAQYQAEEMGFLPPKPVAKKAVPAPQMEQKPKEAPTTTRAVVSESPAITPVAAKEDVSNVEETKVAETQVALVVSDEEEHKDFLEKTLDSIGLDRFCGIDDVALGYRDTYPESNKKTTPFENPTRVLVRELSVQQILHSESHLEKQARQIRKEQHLPPKVYQRNPVNHDFIDPFGVDHDDFVMCGKLADICEPDLDALEQPQVYAITEAPAATLKPAPMAMKQRKEPKEEHEATAPKGDKKEP